MMPSRASTATFSDAPPPYWVASRQPLSILAFLLPLVIAYEVGLAVLLRSGQGVLTIKAHETLLHFFDTFGLSARGGLFLGGAAIIVVLLVWQVLTREPWHVDPATLAMMATESLALTLPLVGVGMIMRAPEAAAAAPDLATMSLGARVAISVGAGLYEELLFRMTLIAVMHTLLVDVARLPSRTGAIIAIVVSAAAFTWYHPLEDAAGAFSLARAGFFFLAGLYFGLVYVVRGFGIVVGTHVLYDVIVVSMLGPASG
jgi:hypothetical protein